MKGYMRELCVCRDTTQSVHDFAPVLSAVPCTHREEKHEWTRTDPRSCFRREGRNPVSCMNFLVKWEESENPALRAATVREAPRKISALARMTRWYTMYWRRVIPSCSLKR